MQSVDTVRAVGFYLGFKIRTRLGTGFAYVFAVTGLISECVEIDIKCIVFSNVKVDV